MIVVDEVVERFRAGDPDAIRDVYHRHAGAVFTVARSITNDRELAADVVQLVFVKAWRAADGFDGSRDLAPWLYAITRRTAIDAIRKENRPTQGGHESEVEGVVHTMSFERTWEAHEVRQAIDELPDGEREVVRLSHLEGLTQEQIAEQLDVPTGTVKSRSSRAHKRLAAALRHLRDDSPDPANQTELRTVETDEDS
jgi:RNA polymerase sigma-70 factor (ECF subfamily)